MENEILLSKLAEKIRTCTLCPLYQGSTNAVPGEGPADAKLFFIGEGPGYYEDQSGRPFVGRAGKLLEETLSKIGLKREEVFIGNVVKHRPPENRDPLPNEIAACSGWLDQQLAIINPKVIVTLGRFSLAKFLGAEKISYVHGQARRVGNYIVLPMYHPAAALRNGSLMREFEQDFIKNKELLQSPEIDLKTEDPEDDSDQIKLFS
ncbi:MAG TPA: uracil-DNA glycosylase [Candidatus Saccharimonadales bacterium]|nr:uracil-DNA glycosylase [Candidatus Saccharimonadales bacterium]